MVAPIITRVAAIRSLPYRLAGSAGGTQLGTGLQHALLGLAAPQGVFALQRGDGVHRIRFPSGAAHRWEFSRGSEKIEVDVDGPLTTGDMRVMVQAAQAGLGFAYVYIQYATDALAAGRLTTVLDDWCPVIPGFFLYYPSRKHLPAGLRALIGMLTSRRQA